MLNLVFMKWVLLAVLIASPVIVWVTGRWSENFAYRTEFSWWIIPVAALIATAIALVTVSGMTWLAARQNPAKSLRYE
jgi:putative ABC transport system permease protein